MDGDLFLRDIQEITNDLPMFRGTWRGLQELLDKLSNGVGDLFGFWSVDELEELG